MTPGGYSLSRLTYSSPPPFPSTRRRMDVDQMRVYRPTSSCPTRHRGHDWHASAPGALKTTSAIAIGPKQAKALPKPLPPPPTSSWNSWNTTHPPILLDVPSPKKNLKRKDSASNKTPPPWAMRRSGLGFAGSKHQRAASRAHSATIAPHKTTDSPTLNAGSTRFTHLSRKCKSFPPRQSHCGSRESRTARAYSTANRLRGMTPRQRRVHQR